jgi:hypothetical protein
VSDRASGNRLRLLRAPRSGFPRILSLRPMNLTEDLVDPFPGYLLASDERSDKRFRHSEATIQ